MTTRTRKTPSRSPGSVVLLRAVNVGGHGNLKVAELARRLAPLEVTNVGAAGTFAVGSDAEPDAVREAFGKEIGLPTNVIVRSSEEFARLWTQRPPAWSSEAPGEKRFVTFLADPPIRTPALPHALPDAARWELRVDARVGADVLSSWRLVGDRRNYYANEVVEKLFGVPSTTRGWDTLEKVRALLRPTDPAPRGPTSRPRRARR